MKGKTSGIQYINSDAGFQTDYKLRHSTWFIAPCLADTDQKQNQFSAEQLGSFQ
jgi:hypothetical protein